MQISFYSPKFKYSGYGASALKLEKYLNKLGVILDSSGRYNEVGILYHLPKYIDQLNSKIKIVFTMIESDDVPKEWIPYLQEADIVVVPSLFCKRVFELALKRKVICVPLGIDEEIYHYIERPERKPFTFLHFDSLQKRKGFWEVIQAWIEGGFDKRKDLQLICKSSSMSPVPPLANYPNIKVINKRWTEEQMLELIGKADAMLFPSWGEGFGMTPLEAMATGIPAITPNQHGIATYFNPDYMLELKTHKIPATYDHIRQRPVGSYTPANIDSIIEKINELLKNYDSYKAKGKEMSEWVLKNWTFSETAKKLLEVIESGKRRSKMITLTPLQMRVAKESSSSICVLENPNRPCTLKHNKKYGKPFKIRPNSRIAIEITSGLGNNILALPAIKSIKEKYPDSIVDIFTYDRAQEIFTYMMYECGIDNVFINGVPKDYKCDVFIKMLCDGRFDEGLKHAEIHTSIYNNNLIFRHETQADNRLVHLIGTEPIMEYPDWKTETKYNGKLPEKYYIVHVGHSHDQDFWRFKHWGSDNYAKLFQKIYDKWGYLPVVVGTEIDREEIETIDFDKKTVIYNRPLTEIAYIANRAKFFVGNDSGIMHFCSLLKIPTFGIFTFTSYIKNAPLGAKSKVIFPKTPCYPCYSKPIDKACDGEKICIKDLTVDKVFNFVYENRNLFS